MQHEYPAFVGALAFVTALPPGQVAALLATRLGLLARQRAEIVAAIEGSLAQGVPGVFLVEEEYRLAQLDTERAFVERLIGRIDSSADWISLRTGHHDTSNHEE